LTKCQERQNDRGAGFKSISAKKGRAAAGEKGETAEGMDTRPGVCFWDAA